MIIKESTHCSAIFSYYKLIKGRYVLKKSAQEATKWYSMVEAAGSAQTKALTDLTADWKPL